MGHCMGFGGAIPLVESRGNMPKAPTTLRYLKPYNYIANSGLIYTRRVSQDRQITKDKMKDRQLEYEEINFVLLQK